MRCAKVSLSVRMLHRPADRSELRICAKRSPDRHDGGGGGGVGVDSGHFIVYLQATKKFVV